MLPLSLISKVIEKIIHNQDMSFLLEDNVLHKLQSCSRKFHSIDSCLSYPRGKFTKCFEFGLLTRLVLVLIDYKRRFKTFEYKIITIITIMI